MIPTKLQDVIDYAVEKEQEAADFYYELAGKIKLRALEKELRNIAAMEEGHRDKLLNLDVGQTSTLAPQKVADLKIAEFLVDKEPDEDMSWQEILTIAMKREQAAQNLYKTLAKMFEKDNAVSNMFNHLASEEASHKLYFEKIYDDEILKEN